MTFWQVVGLLAATCFVALVVAVVVFLRLAGLFSAWLSVQKKPATRGDWTTTPMPAERGVLPVQWLAPLTFADHQFERIAFGLVPAAMEQKWFVFYEEPWLSMHRSWTGICVFQARFEKQGETHRVVEALVNRDPMQLGRVHTDEEAVTDMLTLISSLAGR
jgi:hypothetical protein